MVAIQRASTALPAARRRRGSRRWWLDRSVRAKGLIVIAVPLTALVATSVASLAMQSSERADRDAANTEFALISAANRVLTDALNAETGVRAYAAARDSAFLQPYDAAVRRIGVDQAALRAAAATAGDRARQRAVSLAAATVFDGLGRLRAQIGSGTAPRDLVPPLAQGKASMDRLRQLTGDLIRGPVTQLAARDSAVSAQESAIGVLSVAGLVLGLLAGLAGGALFTTGIARRVARAASNADRLGRGEPVRADRPSADDLGRLNSALARADRLLATRSAELTTARDEAVRATKAKNAFLSSTSHELRTPLNSILGFTQLLELSELTEEDADSVRRILAAGRHLLTLINELIDIARIESGDLSISLEPVLLQPVIEDACQLMRPLAADRSIQMRAETACPALTVRADRQRLAQVLVNLISNAVKYSRRGGTITITAQAGNGQAGVVITDTGTGIAADDLERIFLPFERLGAAQTMTEGTGIGLPLARALTEAMGGQLTAASTPDVGSAFTVTLSRAADMAPAAPPSRPVPPVVTTPAVPEQAPAGAEPALRVLYIEDNPANVEVVARFLKGRPNATLHAVCSAQDGISYAAREAPSVILLDLHLPGMQGEQVLKELKAEPATAAIPVAVLSADASPGTVRRLVSAGALTYLTKPLVLADLDELLGSVSHRQQRQGP